MGRNDDRTVIQCPTCGSFSTEIDSGNICHCRACESVFKQNVGSQISLSNEQFDLMVSIKNAKELLEEKIPKFDEALERFEKLKYEYPDNVEIIWSYLRCKYKIKYIKDVDGTLVPICYNSKYSDITKDPEYQKVLSLVANNPKALDRFTKEGNRIHESSIEWKDKLKDNQFDIFLCYKATEEGEGGIKVPTKDVDYVRKLYNSLTRKKYKVFYAPISMAEHLGKLSYDAFIFDAINKARLFIVYGSKEEFFKSPTAPWVESEWSRYLRLLNTKEKRSDSFVFLFTKNVNPENLPPAFRVESRIGLVVEPDDKRIGHEILNRIDSFFRNYDKDEKPKLKASLNIAKDKDEEETPKKKEYKKSKPIKKRNFFKFLKSNGFKPGEKTVVDIFVEDEEENNATPLKGIINDSKKGKEKVLDFASAETLLDSEKYGEAFNKFSRLVSKDKKNPKALLGVLASTVRDRALYSEVSSEQFSTFTYIISARKAKTFAANIDKAKKIIEYSNSEKFSVVFLNFANRYLSTLIADCSKPGHNNIQDITTIIRFILEYKSEVRNVARSQLVAGFLNVAKRASDKEVNQLIKLLLASYPNDEKNGDKHMSDEFELIIKSLEGARRFKLAELWNKKRLLLDVNNADSLLRAMFYLVGAKDVDAFEKINRKHHVAKKVIKVLQKYLDKCDRRVKSSVASRIASSTLFLFKEADKRDVSRENAVEYIKFLADYTDVMEVNDFFIQRSEDDDLNYLVENEMVDLIGVITKGLFAIGVDVAGSYISRAMARAREIQYFKFANEIAKVGDQYLQTYEKFYYGKVLNLVCVNYDNYDYGDWKKLTTKSLRTIFVGAAPKTKYLAKRIVANALLQGIRPCENHKKISEMLDAFDALTADYQTDKYDKESFIKILYEMATQALIIEEFDRAQYYAYSSLTIEPKNNPGAHYIKLMASVKARYSSELECSPHLDRNSVEYQAALKAYEEAGQTGNYNQLKSMVSQSKKGRRKDYSQVVKDNNRHRHSRTRDWNKGYREFKHSEGITRIVSPRANYKTVIRLLIGILPTLIALCGIAAHITALVTDSIPKLYFLNYGIAVANALLVILAISFITRVIFPSYRRIKNEYDVYEHFELDVFIVLGKILLVLAVVTAIVLGNIVAWTYLDAVWAGLILFFSIVGGIVGTVMLIIALTDY